MPWGSRICPGFVRCPSPCSGEWVRLARSYRVGLAEIKVMGPSEDVRRRLPPPGAVVAWLVTGSRHKADPHLARLLVDRCPGTVPYLVPGVVRTLRDPVSL